MIDDEWWSCLTAILSRADGARSRRGRSSDDQLGRMHIVVFGDFKQLPPATCRPPFIVLPSVHLTFRVSVLRENRRVVTDESRRQELAAFHEILTDISRCQTTDRVRSFLVQAYAQGAMVTAEATDFEGSTSVFTKRRYRDNWNRPIVKRLAKTCAHSLKIRARCRAFYARGSQWLSERRTNSLRRQARSQSLWVLHLAGHWLRDTAGTAQEKHSMRVMLITNVDVKQRFANGTQSKLLWWHPGSVERRKALPSSDPELLARFAKEAAFASKRELLAEVDFKDVQARPEGLKGCSGAAMV